MHGRPPFRHYSGFTLVELMVATALSVILIAVLQQFSVHTLHMTEIMMSRIRFNQEARAAMDIMAYGGVVDKNANSVADLADPYDDPNDEAILGFRGSATLAFAPHGNVLTRDGQRLTLNDAGVNGVFTNSLSTTVDCQALDDPHDDCASATDITVNGMIETDPVPGDGGTRSYTVTKHCTGGAASPTVEVTLSLSDPHMLSRPDEYIADEYKTTYRYMFGMQVDCN